MLNCWISDGLLRNSSDPYAMMRDAYFQRHDFLANGGVLKPQENPNAKAIQGRSGRDRLCQLRISFFNLSCGE
ncbi:Probable phospholipid-binding lipoprotein mlaA precursor [Serratia fonticola]|uniref:Probable phospholipid-binding lipoprotein mlaA n=1 Tax=Serratia fonticola TaxID=47917 RepID=A0A4U9VQE5_SERFO|nr:Probable phospholipid-binding lipoprotein mlaA precursor [Serratia fonticola]